MKHSVMICIGLETRMLTEANIINSIYAENLYGSINFDKSSQDTFSKQLVDKYMISNIRNYRKGLDFRQVAIILAFAKENKWYHKEVSNFVYRNDGITLGGNMKEIAENIKAYENFYLKKKEVVTNMYIDVKNVEICV